MHDYARASPRAKARRAQKERADFITFLELTPYETRYLLGGCNFEEKEVEECVTFLDLIPQTAFFLERCEANEPIKYKHEPFTKELTTESAYFLGRREVTDFVH